MLKIINNAIINQIASLYKEKKGFSKMSVDFITISGWTPLTQTFYHSLGEKPKDIYFAQHPLPTSHTGIEIEELHLCAFDDAKMWAQTKGFYGHIEVGINYGTIRVEDSDLTNTSFKINRIWDNQGSSSALTSAVFKSNQEYILICFA